MNSASIPALISIRYGDTATSPFGFGTFASRSIVFGGGAVASACRMLAEKIQQIGAHLLQTDVGQMQIEDGAVHGPSGSVGFAEIAYAANVRQEHLPAGIEPLLDVTGTYEPTETGGVFAYGTHAVVVAVEPDTGVVEILDYAVSEDCGTMINPMIVDGQVQGGIAQGIGTALYEEIPYDEIGQPLATTFGDYMVPCAPEIPTCGSRISSIRPRPPNTASKASAKAARSRRRRPSPTRCPTRSAASARVSTRRR